MHPLVAPSIGRAKVALAFNCFAAAPIIRLVLTVAARAADPLDIGAVVVMRHTARSITILNFRVVDVAPDAVEDWGRGERREKGGKGDKDVWWGFGNMGKHVCVQRLWGDGGDEGVEAFRRWWQCLR